MKKVYMCGNEPVANDSHCTFETNKVKKRLESMRCSVINPPELQYFDLGWTDVMETRIKQLKKCQAVYVFPDWRNNIMARIELTVAMDLKLQTIFHPSSNKEIRQIITSLGN